MWPFDSIVATAIETINQVKLLIKQSTQGLIGAKSKLKGTGLKSVLLRVSSGGINRPDSPSPLQARAKGSGHQIIASND